MSADGVAWWKPAIAIFTHAVSKFILTALAMLFYALKHHNVIQLVLPLTNINGFNKLASTRRNSKVYFQGNVVL